jgi:drug/metabolite transporter (DMT)-like permease
MSSLQSQYTEYHDGVEAERPAGARAGIDALLVVMVLIWGVNYSVLKRAFAEIPPQPFNALRMVIASGLFLAAIRVARRRAEQGPLSRVFHTPNPLTRRDRIDLLWLGFVGHCCYQFCFVAGVAATSVSNAALIIGATPVSVAVLSAALGRERIGPLHWLGAAISVSGIYFVIGLGASFGGSTLTGDLLVLVSVGCWTAYTLGATRLIARHSPLYVTGMTMVIGGVPYVLLALPSLIRLDWAAPASWTWIALVLSAIFALNIAYLIWYTAVQKIGPSRTAIYSNVVPIAAMAVATVWLGEPLTHTKLIGATAVLTGVALTRTARQKQGPGHVLRRT